MTCPADSRSPPDSARERLLHPAVPPSPREEPGQKREAVRVAAFADPHYTRTSRGTLLPLFAEISAWADVLLICGDLTNSGLVEDAQILARDLTSGLRIPVISVLGNHDHEAGKEAEIRQILFDAGITVLDGDACEVAGIGFAGVKGFGGGFDQRSLAPWGEEIIKNFVREAVDEALKLEGALAKLRTDERVALLHYAPIRDTVEGEPLEIYPFLGSSRLEEPLNRYGVTAAFHGHAHRGKASGRTKGNIPVHNVSLPVLLEEHPDRPPYFRLELSRKT